MLGVVSVSVSVSHDFDGIGVGRIRTFLISFDSV